MNRARSTEAPDDPPSPCVRVCRLDAEGRFCLGCGRTLGEIARWRDAAPAERRAILARLAARRARPSG